MNNRLYYGQYETEHTRTSVQDVRGFRGSYIGSDHFLVIRKTHQDSWDALISNIEADVHGRQEVTY